MRWRLLLLCVPMLLIGCTHVTRPTQPGTNPEAPTKAMPGRFEPIAGRGPDVIAELRAEPAKAPEFIESESSAKDEQTLSSKGYVKVADGYYAGVDADSHAWLQKQGKAIGADKVYFYTVEPDAQSKVPSLHAVYYVKFKLPFGASFRDLKAEEREQVGASGVRIGKVIGGSPAADANLRAGDIILKVDSESIAGRAAFEKLLRKHMGKRVTLTISRNGKESTRLVRLGVLASELNKNR
jgi:C-terminal processing protease CtpA/Prc